MYFPGNAAVGGYSELAGSSNLMLRKVCLNSSVNRVALSQIRAVTSVKKQSNVYHASIDVCTFFLAIFLDNFFSPLELSLGL